MDRSDVVFLIKETFDRDEYGVLKSEKTEREVFCNIGSISQKEFYRAGEQGLKPQYKITLSNAADYEGEELLKLHNKEYVIYRTYINKTEAIELYVTEKIGAKNGKS